MTQIAIIGLGNWGTAIANHLAVKGFKVLGWSIEEDVVKSINDSHRNLRYLSQVELSDNLTATGNLQEALSEETIILVVPSSVLGEIVPRLREMINDGPTRTIISAIKGIEASTLLTPLEYSASVWKDSALESARLVVFSGPTFAVDVVVQKPCGVVAASRDPKAAENTAQLFSCPWMKVYMSDDPLGVELGGILKNVIAIAAGVCDGIGLGDSARTGLITRGLAEMMRLSKAMGANAQTLSGLSGLGDLVMTATCDASRNRTVGLRLGRGEKLPDIIESLGSVAEGVRTTPLVLKLAQEHLVEMPVSVEVAKLLDGQTTPQQMLGNLINRPLKKEF